MGTRTPVRSGGWLAAALALCSALACSPDPRERVQGVIVVSFDAMRADVLGSYGHSRVTSPQLDAVAKESVLFEHAYSAAPTTPSSFAAMFTGRLPHTSLAGWQLAEGPTLAEVFTQAGYKTAAFANNPQIGAERGFDAGFAKYQVPPKGSDEEILAAGIEWLRRYRDQPFLLWIHVLDPHAPWLHLDESKHLYDDSYRGVLAREVSGLLRLVEPAELARARSLYEGEVYRADELFGRLWRTVQAFGLDERIALVVTSDHGEELMDHGLLQHGQLTEENIHVPLFLRLPGGRDARRIATPVSTIDLASTLLDLAGIPSPEGFAGRSLLDRSLRQRTIVSMAVAKAKKSAASIRQGDEKLILHCTGAQRHELYDLAADPDERNDLAEAQPERAQALERELWKAVDARGCADLPLSRGKDPELETRGLDEEELRALKALGYLQEDPVQ